MSIMSNGSKTSSGDTFQCSTCIWSDKDIIEYFGTVENTTNMIENYLISIPYTHCKGEPQCMLDQLWFCATCGSIYMRLKLRALTDEQRASRLAIWADEYRSSTQAKRQKKRITLWGK